MLTRLHLALSSAAADTAQHRFISRYGGQLVVDPVSGQPSAPRARGYLARLPTSTVMTFSGALRMQGQALEQDAFVLGLSRTAALSVNGTPRVGPGGTILVNIADNVPELSARGDGLVVKMPRRGLLATQAALAEDGGQMVLLDDLPRLSDADADRSRRAARIVAHVISESEREGLGLERYGHSLEYILHAAVLGVGATGGVSPRLGFTGPYVARAVDYMEAHFREDISPLDIARAAGCSLRTLELYFRALKGITVVKYLTLRRLEEARQVLRRSDGSRSVTEAAVSAGFTHFGRFSIGYRRHFGVSPSKDRPLAG